MVGQELVEILSKVGDAKEGHEVEGDGLEGAEIEGDGEHINILSEQVKGNA